MSKHSRPHINSAKPAPSANPAASETTNPTRPVVPSAPGADMAALGDLVRAMDAAKDVPPGLDRTERNLRTTVIDRRLFPDRRNIVVDGQRLNPDGSPATDTDSGLERRRGPGRRLSDFTRSAEEGEMTREQFLFLMAIDEFKKSNDKAYPTWTDVLEVVRLLGYRKTMKSEISLRRAEDWFELADSPSNVRPQRWSERRRGPGQTDIAA